MLVVGAERQAGRVNTVADHTGEDVQEVFGGAPLPHQHRHACAQLFPRLFVSGALMVGMDARRHICLQPFPGKGRCMPVDHAFAKQFQFGEHLRVAARHPRIVHHLAQPQHPRVGFERFHLLSGEHLSGVLERGCRHTGGYLHIVVDTAPFGCPKHKPDTLCAQNICDLVRVGNQRGDPPAQFFRAVVKRGDH